jgi:hypothetical protein
MCTDDNDIGPGPLYAHAALHACMNKLERLLPSWVIEIFHAYMHPSSAIVSMFGREFPLLPFTF